MQRLSRASATPPCPPSDKLAELRDVARRSCGDVTLIESVREEMLTYRLSQASPRTVWKDLVSAADAHAQLQARRKCSSLDRVQSRLQGTLQVCGRDKENRRIVWEIKALAKWTRDYQSSRLQAEFIDTITGLVQFAIQDRRAGEPFDVVLYIDVIDAGLLNFGLSVPGHAAGNFPALFGALTRIVFFGRKNGMSGGAKVMFDMLQNYLPVEVVFESGGRENVLNWVQSKEDVPPQFFDPAATRLMPRSEAVWAAFQKMHASEGDQWTMADVFLHEPSEENTEALSAGDSGLLCREKEQVDDERAKEACSPFTRHERTLKETASRRQSLPAIEELGDGALDEVAEGDEDEQW